MQTTQRLDIADKVTSGSKTIVRLTNAGGQSYVSRILVPDKISHGCLKIVGRELNCECCGG